MAGVIICRGIAIIKIELWAGFYKMQVLRTYTSTDRVVTIEKCDNGDKIVRKRFETDYDYVRELAAYKLIKTWNSQYFPVGLCDDVPYELSWKYCGRSLTSVAAADDFPRDKKRFIEFKTEKKIVGGILNGVLMLHRHSIAHCDLKSCNIVLDDKFNPRIIDFGLAEIPANHDISGPSPTSEIITAPENINDSLFGILTNGNPYSLIYSDIWALGITLFTTIGYKDNYSAMMCGINMAPDSRYAIYCKLFGAMYKVPDYMSISKYKPMMRGYLYDIISGCLSPYPSERPLINELLDMI